MRGHSHRRDAISFQSLHWRRSRIEMQTDKDGRIHRIESLKAWTTCCDPNHTEAAVFEICKDCGNVTEHINKRLVKTLAALSEHSGFSPKHSVMEIHGSCKDCEPQLEKL